MSSCYIIAEAGVNHNGSAELAHRMIEIAAHCGADAVKFQTFVAAELATSDAPKARYQLETTDTAQSQQDMLRSLELTESDYLSLAKAAEKAGIEFLSTPFDRESADLLNRVGMKRFKIPSGELVNLPLLRHVGSLGKPVILSTGMSYIGEVELAVRTLEDAGASEITILHCTSCYPTAPQDCNLNAMKTLHAVTGCPVGYSDHTVGLEIPCAAVALGATVIEKHFTLDRTMPGPDHRASIEPDELRVLVRSIRSIEASLGDGIKRPTQAELNTREIARRSLVAAHDLESGTVIAADHLTAKRPGTGISPVELDRVIGRKLIADVEADELLDWKHIQ